MSFKMHVEGERFLSELLAGSDKKINGMYVEYGTELSDRDHAFYRRIENNKTSGYARIGITDIFVDDDGVIRILGVLSTEDIRGEKPTKPVKLTCVTLVHKQDDNPDNDTIVCTIKLSSPVKLVEGTYTSIHTSMRLVGA